MNPADLTTFSPAREGPQAPTLAREAGTPTPKPDENRGFFGLQEFSGQNASNCSLRARGVGLSNPAPTNNLLESQAKLALNTTSNETLFRVFSGGQLDRHLGVNWGSIKQKEPIFLGLQSQNGGDLR